MPEAPCPVCGYTVLETQRHCHDCGFHPQKGQDCVRCGPERPEMKGEVMTTNTRSDIDPNTGEMFGIPARDKYVPPPVRSPEWIAELRRASEECEMLLWGLATSGHFTTADELQAVAKAHKIAMELNKLANEKLSQIGYGS